MRLPVETHLDMWTIYRNPSDYPGMYVARRSRITAAGVNMDAAAFTGRTLDEVRAWVPPGLVRMPGDMLDDPCIVEAWF